MNAALDAAYRATAYVVFGPEDPFPIRIDEKTPALDDLLVRHFTRTWAFVTAWNPSSQILAGEENRRRQEALETLVREAKYPYYPGQGVGADPAWTPEASLLILGISPDDAAGLGRRFRQNAIVIGEIGAPARLLWLTD